MMKREKSRGVLLSSVSSRASFEWSEEDVQQYRAMMSASDLSHYPCPPQRLSTTSLPSEDFLQWKVKHPDLLHNFKAFSRAAEGKLLAVFLDYDGTLTPIVNDPDRAFMSDEMRQIVREVAELFPTAVISGRGREKVEDFVKLKELYYAGSHGLDIAGPQNGLSVGKLIFQPAAKFGPVMDEIFFTLTERMKSIPGSSVEHNKFCVSVHFRNCDANDWPLVVPAVEEVLKTYTELKITRGRKVLEVRPKVDWDKGTALEHLVKALQLDDPERVLAIYIGDDRTDEDAFRMLKKLNLGFGVLVSSKVKETEAKYTLTDPFCVMEFLSELVEWGRSSANQWLKVRPCSARATETEANGLIPHDSIASATPQPSCGPDSVTKELFGAKASHTDASKTSTVSPFSHVTPNGVTNGLP